MQLLGPYALPKSYNYEDNSTLDHLDLFWYGRVQLHQ